MTRLFINGSPRVAGNTAHLAQRVLAGLDYDTLQLSHYQINQIQDYRQTDQDQRDDSDDFAQLMTQVAAADDLIIGTPVYWYGMTGYLKTFLDRWYESYTQGFKFSGKRVYLLIVGADQPEEKASGIYKEISYSCDWLHMTFAGRASITADQLGDVANMANLPERVLQLRDQLLADA